MAQSERYQPLDHIEVRIWGKFVGALARDPSLGYYVFAYDSGFAKSGIELAPLQMPLNTDERPYVFTDLPIATYHRLPALLADALPDDFGNALVDRYMATKGIPSQKITPLDRLGYMGTRAMGALEFRPLRGPRNITPTAITLNRLISEARKVVQGVVDNDEHAVAALRSMIDVGTSAGGARAKAVVGWNPKTEEIVSGQHHVPPGFEHWIIKFDAVGVDRELGASQDYGRIEYAYSLMAKAIGIKMTPCRLLEEGGRAHFMTKRFDRGQDGVKHHLQSLCSMAHMDYKKKQTHSYEQLFITLHELGLGHDTMVEAFRRMVFNVLGRNCDDHTKNVAFLLKEGQSWTLAPAYDVTFAHNPQGEWTSSHLMAINNRFQGITRGDLLAVAGRFGIGEAREIIEQSLTIIEGWPDFAKVAGIHADVVAAIGAAQITKKALTGHFRGRRETSF